jgi:hypothetical protein
MSERLSPEQIALVRRSQALAAEFHSTQAHAAPKTIPLHELASACSVLAAWAPGTAAAQARAKATWALLAHARATLAQQARNDHSLQSFLSRVTLGAAVGVQQ